MFKNKLKLNRVYSDRLPKIVNNSSLTSLYSGKSGLASTKCQEPWSGVRLQFQFLKHVSQVIKSSRVHARDLYRIRPLLDLNTSVLLANALVSSRLDYCNSLFLLLTDFELRRLQLVQNSLCRVVNHSSKSSHITPQLKKLHCLQVRYRVQFKIGLITFKILNQGQPVYLRELIHPYTSSRNTKYPQTQVPSNPHF